MAENRSPSGILVNGVVVRVKDPNAASGALFSDWVRVPGLTSVTLPDEVGATTDAPQLDGTLSAAAYSGVGQIVAPIGGLSVHASHQWLYARKLDQKQILMDIIKPASGLVIITEEGKVAAMGHDIVIADPAAKRSVANVVKAGMLVYLATAVPPNDVGFINYDVTAVAGDQTKFRIVHRVEKDGSKIVVWPYYHAEIVKAAGNQLAIRHPGKHWADISGVVNGFGSGDLQNASNLSGNLTFAPQSVLADAVPEHRLEKDIAGLA